MEKKINKKIINNAISAYMGLSFLLLIPSKEENINNIFVKNHAKTACFIHILFLIIYIIFISFGFLSDISFKLFEINFFLNHIFALISFSFLFFLLIVGGIRSYKGKEFFIIDIFHISKTDNLFENKNSNLNEEGNTAIILSLTPIIGLLIPGLFYYENSNILNNNFKINIIFTLFITFLFISGKNNIALIFILLYIIGLVFLSIKLIFNKQIIILNIDFIPDFRDLYLNIKILFTYIKNFFSKNNFKSLKDTKILINSNYLENQKKDEEIIRKLKNPKLGNKIFFIPFLNIISVIDINSNNRFLLLNGLGLTLMGICFLIFLNNSYLIIIFFISIFLFGQKQNLNYKLPFLYEISNLLYRIILKILNIINKLQKTHKDNKKVIFNATGEINTKDIKKLNEKDKINI